MNQIFVDSFYYIAFLNPRDRFHDEAVRISRQLRRPLVTTVWVLTELADALASPARRRVTHRFIERFLLDPNTQLILVEPDWLSRGLALHGARMDKAWSLTDCISFAVMGELGLTGDYHFEQAGFQALFRQP